MNTINRSRSGVTYYTQWAVVTSLLAFATPSIHADDNLLAHQLFRQQDFARAAEIFTDPTWKGVALYRSSQWWRAAEAFVRANDPVSSFNLGNSYVKLGYYELALDAYLQALSMDPTLSDASHNADIMRQLLATDDDDATRGGRQPSGDAIDQLESDDKPDESGGGSGGQEQSDVGETPTGQSEEAGEQTMGSQSDAVAGDGGEASREEKAVPDTQDGSGAIDGEVSDDQNVSRPSGSSETQDPTADSQAGGKRGALEAEQATTQWLNQINHDSRLYLRRRIELEQKRRTAAGQQAPGGGSSW